MRENGLPKVSWRWAPCAAFVLGSLSFVTFALVAIPDHIGHVDAESTSNSLRFGNALARTQSPQGSQAQNDWSGDTTNTASATPSPGVRSMQPSLVMQNADGIFPKRGFTPPLERPEPPPAPPPPQLTPAQQQPQLNVPPPVPAPPPPPAAEPPPAAPPPQPELVPQAAPVPAPAEAAPAPAPSTNN